MASFKPITEFKIKDVKNAYSRPILALFSSLYPEYIYAVKKARKPNSNLIKYNLVKLGHDLGFRVYANGLTPEQLEEQKLKYHFVNREFLFDIHWYRDKADYYYTPESISLVGESELGDRRKGDQSKRKNPAVMFDFQKLLVANAELRLLIFKVRNKEELEALDDYFIKAIRAYQLLRKGSPFLFVCFMHSSKMLYFSEKRKA